MPKLSASYITEQNILACPILAPLALHLFVMFSQIWTEILHQSSSSEWLVAYPHKYRNNHLWGGSGMHETLLSAPTEVNVNIGCQCVYTVYDMLHTQIDQQQFLAIRDELDPVCHRPSLLSTLYQFTTQ